MADQTSIEWADATVNWWAGCTAVSQACDHCYAQQMAGRLWGTKWGSGQERQRFDGAFKTLEALERKARRLGRPLRVFHNSLSDFFDNEVPESWRIDALSAMEQAPNLIHLLLTKRIGNAAAMLPWSACSEPPPNVWIGATIVNQAEADRDIPKLLAVPAAKRFLSMEPLLGPVDLSRWLAIAGNPPQRIPRMHNKPLHWVIVGGESGPGARPMHPDWARSLRDQCKAAGVPFLFKQWGEWTELDTGMPQPLVAHFGDPEWRDAAVAHDGFLSLDGHFTDNPDLMNDDVAYRGLVRLGKKAAGRLLDGHTWDEVPE